MGFWDLMNIRSTIKQLNDLMPAVEANCKRFRKFYDDNFADTKKSYGSIFNEINERRTITTTQECIDEFIRLKNDLEYEFEHVKKIVEKTKPLTILDDNRVYASWNNRLYSISIGYIYVINEMNNCKIYIKK